MVPEEKLWVVLIGFCCSDQGCRRGMVKGLASSSRKRGIGFLNSRCGEETRRSHFVKHDGWDHTGCITIRHIRGRSKGL